MSKEFEQALNAAREGLPTMSQGFMSTQSCYEARELHMFRAGRALGRREMKGEAADVAWDMLVDGVTWGHDGNCGSPEIVKRAIEAIPEEG